MESTEPGEALFIGGRSGVGKSAVALETSHLLAEAHVQHAVIEGDNLDLAYPPPWHRGLRLAELNLAAMWRNYRRAGYRRLVYANTVSVLEREALAAAMGGLARSVGVLLTARDETVRARLALREVGSALDRHLERSDRAARELEANVPDSVARVVTDGRSVTEIARELIALVGWREDERTSG